MNIDKLVLRFDEVPNTILSYLESRDVGLWLGSVPENLQDDTRFLKFLSLPWKYVFLKSNSYLNLDELEKEANKDLPLVRKRGFVQIIDNDPSRIELPQRCLPIYLLGGRNELLSSSFEDQLRKMTMLDVLRRSNIRQLLILSGETDPIPEELRALWETGFRSHLTLITDFAEALDSVEQWIEASDGVAPALSNKPAYEIVLDLLNRYLEGYPDDVRVIRVRDSKGEIHKVDVTDIDEPERPLLSHFELILDKDLELLLPEELKREEFEEYFQNAQASWRPYAAGLPWIQDSTWREKLNKHLKKIDNAGPVENCIAHVLSEEGAGGTTISRYLAWEFAREGYPVLLAKPMPFLPDALLVGNYLNRARLVIEEHAPINREQGTKENKVGRSKDKQQHSYYEAPWIIVFDRMHWESRESELVRFKKDLQKQGRPVCILSVVGPLRSLGHYTMAYKEVAELSHSLDKEEALKLGAHLNKFLRVFGRERAEWQWENFYNDHTVKYIEGVAAFWVTLSFWIQSQYDLSMSIQEWIYQVYKKNVHDEHLKRALVKIAALSSERLPLPDGLLPATKGSWPVAHLLQDNISNLGGLGLVRRVTNGEKYWAFAHDILGRYLINAIFYDFTERKNLGYENANDANHLRFLILKEISHKPELGEKEHRTIGEDFATTVFKVDPDHGFRSFVVYWRDILKALDEMPSSLKNTSRVFRHHVSVSRRRIAKLELDIYGVTIEDKIDLLQRAVDDIKYALESIDYTPGAESNINLYNSLANAYLDLAKIQSKNGAPLEQTQKLQQLADEATRKAFEENPDNSFVIETYVKNKLSSAEQNKNVLAKNCIEILGVLFSVLCSSEGEYRRTQLSDLANQALELLLGQTQYDQRTIEPQNAIDVLVKAWAILYEGTPSRWSEKFIDIPTSNVKDALHVLDNPIGQGNMHIARLNYDLLCIDSPGYYSRQLDLVELLINSPYRISPQLRLEYAVLLYQNGRFSEGNKIFYNLRRLWQENEYFVKVPDRLRWLRNTDDTSLRTVNAIIGSDYGQRPMARVREFADQLILFRSEEFGFREPQPRTRFTSYVSFSHNGPFLRPLTSSGVKQYL